MQKKIWEYILIVLVLFAASVWVLVFSTTPTLQIVACDVGQGDAILVNHGQDQILFDGGLPNGKVIDCLGKYMPVFDRKIELIVLSHPQLDHFGGLVEVVQRYNVDLLVANSLDSGSSEYQALKNEVGSRGIRVLTPSTTTDLRMGLLYLDIVWPTSEFLAENQQEMLALNQEAPKVLSDKVLGTTTSNRDPNDFSIVAILRFGDYDALFTGDIGPSISDQVAQIISDMQMDKIEYIKVPHHGSKNGMSEKLLQAVMPDVAVISAGRENRYGHPHEEILNMLNKYGIKIRNTQVEGDVILEVTN